MTVLNPAHLDVDVMPDAGAIPFIVRGAKLCPGHRLTEGRFVFVSVETWLGAVGTCGSGFTMSTAELVAQITCGCGGWLAGPEYRDPAEVERPMSGYDADLVARIAAAVAAREDSQHAEAEVAG